MVAKFLHSIKFKIFKIVFGIFFIVIAFGSYYNYLNIKKEITLDTKKETKQLIKLLQKQITVTLYNFDYINTKKTIDSFLNKEYFTKIQIIHEDGTLFADTTQDTIKKVQKIKYQSLENGIAEEKIIFSPIITSSNENIGSIIIYKHDELYKKAMETIQHEIFLAYIITVISVLIAAYIASFYITRPIIEMIDKLNHVGTNEELKFNIQTHDEFEYLSHAIETKHNLLKEQMVHDTLTGVYNRSKFNSTLECEIQKHNRNQVPFCLAIIDFDFFKKVNDTYGHLVGDQVLIEISVLISKSIRSTDIFARWGGEEFSLLMYNTSINGATHLLEKLRKNIENYPLDKVGHVTCSFGVSEYKKNETQTDLIRRCDEALYLAKQSGRNNVYSL